jgi:hypothetical protein
MDLCYFCRRDYAREIVRQYITESKWGFLEYYLISAVIQGDKRTTSKYAPIILLIRRAELSELVATEGTEKAESYYKDNIQPLLIHSSDFINGPAMKKEIDDIAIQINTGEVTIPLHMERDIDDFFRLYLPKISG